MMADLVNSLWYGDAAAARVGRALLAPLAKMFETVATRRARAYDGGARSVVASPIPAISVGNLTVGGTGKTPFAAMLVARLRALGRHPALVMRGYGGDEPTLHEWLNPGVPVFADPDRARAIALAAESGADVAVLDDAFQHRRARRDLDIVLVSVERWRDDLRLLPAGPLREPLTALRRAGLVVLTVKSATAEATARVRTAVSAIAPGVPLSVATFTLDALHSVDADAGDASLPLTSLRAADVLAVAAIGDPASFFAQLEGAGARVTRVTYGDHHAYTAREAEQLAALGRNHKYVVTTAKDAVKLRRVWPANAPRPWYVSQAVAVSDGASLLDAALRRALTR